MFFSKSFGLFTFQISHTKLKIAFSLLNYLYRMHFRRQNSFTVKNALFEIVWKRQSWIYEISKLKNK